MYHQHKKALIGFGIPVLLTLIAGLFFFLGRSTSPNCQMGAIQCPLDWIGHRGRCYKPSEEEKNWQESQNACISLDASLAKITDEEMEFVKTITDNDIFWIGLRRKPNQPWKWPDGEHSTWEVLGDEDCVFLDDGATPSSGRCSTEHRYICKKITQRS
ncbi:C-type lectin domain family 2 member B-like [Candoia aspera]|uniref:C-type lectin domain family 2 member B-like n=1 Tax=Candoia aspera TaxID=51853 RepID=UPI002FD823C7